MKRVTKQRAKNAPVIRINVVESAKGNSIKLKIEILSVQPNAKHRVRHIRRKNPFRAFTQTKTYAARPVIGYMNIYQKIELGQRVYLHLLNNSDFPDIYPTPDFFQVIVECLDDAYYEALHGGEKERQWLGETEKDFDDMYSAIVRYVDSKANGSEAVYRSAGIEPILIYQKRGNAT